ncbi:transcriptional regulator of sulfur amino acid metabolism [Basidiobolus ranarum]|uniref:Transcriptional regulator of sulfur amino acid metabolism n=1 Tax=Basidiobolus ranarum TaxID=34480 RepID=A0ABR2VVG6_9FUNG
MNSHLLNDTTSMPDLMWDILFSMPTHHEDDKLSSLLGCVQTPLDIQPSWLNPHFNPFVDQSESSGLFSLPEYSHQSEFNGMSFGPDNSCEMFASSSSSPVQAQQFEFINWNSESTDHPLNKKRCRGKKRVSKEILMFYDEIQYPSPPFTPHSEPEYTECKETTNKRSLPTEKEAGDNKKSEKSKERVFSCDHCQRVFARKYDLERHQRLHTGYKPYKCVRCHKGFTRVDARQRHYRSRDCQNSIIIVPSPLS